MRGLWQDLPETRRGAYAESAAELEPILLDAIGPGDVIMMKASLGTRLGPLVDALKRSSRRSRMMAPHHRFKGDRRICAGELARTALYAWTSPC